MADESEGERLRVKLAVMVLEPSCAGGARTCLDLVLFASRHLGICVLGGVPTLSFCLR